MTVFTTIKKTIAGDKVKKDFEEELRERYYAALIYMANIAYNDHTRISQRLTEMGCKDIIIYHTDGTQAILAEFDTTVVVAFRGTNADDADDRAISRHWQMVDFFGIKAYGGYVRCINRVGSKIAHDLVGISGKKVIYTGHSMGGAMAILMGMYHKPDEIVTYGAPKVSGGKAFFRHFTNVSISRVASMTDFITLLPPYIPWFIPYQHIGNLILLKGKLNIRKPMKSHTIRAYLKAILIRQKELDKMQKINYNTTELNSEQENKDEY